MEHLGNQFQPPMFGHIRAGSVRRFRISFRGLSKWVEHRQTRLSCCPSSFPGPRPQDPPDPSLSPQVTGARRLQTEGSDAASFLTKDFGVFVLRSLGHLFAQARYPFWGVCFLRDHPDLRFPLFETIPLASWSICCIE